MNLFFSIVLFAILTSCASPHLQKQKVLNGFNYTHIVSHCNIYDLNFNIVYNATGSLCVFEDNGDLLIARNKTLFLYDKNMHLLWKTEVHVHHMLKKSVLHDQYLALAHKDFQSNGKHYRYDIPVVFDRNGKIAKTFDFFEYVKNNSKNPAAKNLSFNTLNSDNNTVFTGEELTHFNSFYELYETHNGVKKLTGYVVNDSFNEKIFIFDADLKKILKTVSGFKRKIHDVQQFNQDKLIFYTNMAILKDRPKRTGAIEIYDFKTDEFSVYYKNPDIDYNYPACSSVQMLSPSKLFIFHAVCHGTGGKFQQPAFEFVDIDENRRVTGFLPETYKLTAAYLFDAGKFLKNNIGR